MIIVSFLHLHGNYSMADVEMPSVPERGETVRLNSWDHLVLERRWEMFPTMQEDGHLKITPKVAVVVRPM